MPTRLIFNSTLSIDNDSSNLWLIPPRHLQALMQLQTVVDFVHVRGLKSVPMN